MTIVSGLRTHSRAIIHGAKASNTTLAHRFGVSTKITWWNWTGRNMRIEAIDLFCGIGGLTYGLKTAGITVLAGLDNDNSWE
jgi:hypothetical protein